MDGELSVADVLVVEDDQGCVDLIEEVIRELGHGAVCCERIDDAIKLLGERPIRLVILDVMLPDGDGFGLLQATRSDPKLAALPVMLCTAALFDVTEYRKPVNDPLTELVSKPFHIETFVQVAERLLAAR